MEQKHMRDLTGRIADLSPEKRALLTMRLRKKRETTARLEGIPRRTELSSYPLSSAQERLWFLNQMEPESPSYNVPAAIRLKGHLDVPALERSLISIAERHEVLRASFPSVDGEPVQIVSPALDLKLEVQDISHLSGNEQTDEAAGRASAEARKPFDLSASPLLRTQLLRLQPDDHVLLLTVHHIVFDGWSTDIFLREISQGYEEAARGGPISLQSPTIQYADFAAWQRQWLDGEVLERQLGYWKKKLGGGSYHLDLPTDRPRPHVLGDRGARYSFTLSEDLSGELRALSTRNDATAFITLLAAFQLLLHRYASRDDIRVGAPVSNRTRAEIEGLVGFFVNTLVMKADFSADLTFRTLLNQVRETALAAYANQDIPFEKLVEELNPERDMSATPLFQVVFDLRQPPLNGLRLGGLEASLLEPEGAAAKFDMNLTMTEGPRGLTGDFQFNTDLFETETIARMATHYETLLRGIIADPDRPVSMIPMLSEAERNQIEAWNDTAAPIDYDRTLHELFDEQVERTPDAPALVFDGAEMTYAELQKRANQVAWYLMNRGVTRGSLVGVCIERSFEMIIGMLGILKAGGAYVPLDPSYPRDRLAVMIADSRLSVLLTQRDLLPELPVQNLHPVCLDSDWAEIARESKSGPDVTVDSKDLAYIIYTSGSTGTPKGTLMTHRGVCNLVPEWCRSFDVGVGSRVLQFFSAGFDGSVGEIFPTLLSGGALCLVSRQTVLSTQDLHKYMQDQRISTTIITPSYLSVLSHEELPDLGVVLAGGESCPRELAERWGADRRFYNLYGPTESTVVVCCHESDGDIGAAATVPVGRPIANIQFHILDAMFNPVPVGVPGELHIGGVALARGYLNRPDMTAERFIPDPFHAEAGVRMYRTGDLARYLSDGSVEILGRMDHQVKIRGFRVELGEIEAALRTHHEVQEVVVLVREDSPGIKRLTAYIVPDQDPGPSAGSLRDFLKERLPDYMVPSAYVVMDEFPLNSNEKVDRKSLPVPDMEAEEEERGVPRTPVEEMLAGIWSQVLGVEKVGINDNFFDLGGHSLLATQLTSRIRKAFGVELPLRTIFEYSTVAGVAGEVEKALRENRQIEVPPLQRVARSDEMPLSFAQQRLWFLDQFIPGSPLYNIVGAVRLAGPLDPEVLDRCLAEIIRRHESLRTVFHSVDGKAVQRILPPFNFAFRQFDHRTVPDTDREDLTIRLIREEACQPFELSEGPLVRGVLVQLDEQEHVAAFVMHHIISDGWSMSVLVRELGALYQAYSTGNEPSLPGLTVQYPDYTQWQRSWLQGKPLDSQLAYWKKTLEGLPPILDLPTDRPRPPVQTTSGARRQFRLPPELGDALKSLSVQEGTTLFMTLLGGFQILLMRYTENEDISVGTPIAGRNRAEIEDVIGLFVNTLVMRTDLSGEPTVREVLHRVRDVALKAYAHQDVPFEKVVDAVEPERDLSHTPLFQVMFALQNVPSEALNLPGLALRPMDVDIGVAIFDLTLTMVADEQGLRGSLEYNTDLFDDSTIERMVEHFRVTLEGMVADAEQRIPQLGLLSEAEGRRLLVDWNDTAAPFHHDGTLHELFDLQVEKTPNAQAVVCDNQELTYKQLQTRANQLAQFLLRLGVERGTLVGVLLERSVDMVVGLLAILKAGAAYVPLDPSYPPNRLEYILGDARAAILLTQSDVLSSVKAESVRTVLLDRELPDISRESNEPPQIGVTAEDLAYVIYTSGSTGTPKGVMISHRAALNLSAGLEQIVYADRARAELRLSLNAPISFDASVQQLVMLLHGHSLYIPPEEIRRDPDAFVSYIRTNRLDVLDCVPAQLKLLISGGLIDGTDWAPSVVLPGGEAIDGEMWKSLAEAPGTGFFNMYGPTECAVDSSICPVKGGPAKPSIGRPIVNARMYILDKDLQPVPIGVPGELHIAGAGLGRGYHDRASLTAERFIPEPFSGLKGARMYKTGDLVRYMADGNIEFLGRIDHQVKVRGFRIELGEIEASLRQHEKIDEVVVVVREDIRGSKRLVAYIVPAESSDLEPSTLRSFLEERLPDYMVPSSWVVMEQLPLTPSGKIDRRALPVPDAGHPELARSSISPRTPTEQKLAEVWKEVLGLEHVGVEDNFFELGGDSILSIQLIARAKQVGFQITPKQIFQHPTISRLASIAESGPGVQAEQGVVTGSVLLTPIQRRFFDQEYPEPHHWNQSVLLEIHDQLKPDRLEATVRHMLRHHDALRMRFEHTPDGWDQENASIDNEHILSWIDLSEADAAAAIVEIERKGTELQSSLDLSKGPLIRLAYFDRGERESGRLLILIHHLVIDGVSWRILLEDFHTVYQQISAGKPVQLPAKTTSFQDWAMKLREYAQSQTLKSEAQYWRRFGRVRWKVSSIPLDHEEGSDTEESAEWITTGLSKDETDTLLREVPRILHADISALLLTPLARTFSQWTGKRSWLVDLEGHGRDPILDGVDVSRTVGWFTTVYPIILDLGASHHLMDHLDQVKTSLERTVPYGMGFGLLRYSTEDPAVNDQLSNLPQAEVSFNYLGQFDHTLDGNTLFSLAHEKAGADLGSSSRRSHLLGVAGRVVEGSLEIAWNFSTNRHSRETIERLARSYLDELRGIIHLAGSSDSAKEAEPDDRQHELSQKEMEDLLEELQGGEDL